MKSVPISTTATAEGPKRLVEQPYNDSDIVDSLGATRAVADVTKAKPALKPCSRQCTKQPANQRRERLGDYPALLSSFDNP